MRIALFAPVNHPDRLEGRDALRLARALATRADLTVFVRLDPARPTPEPAGLRVKSQQAFERLALAGAFDFVLYFLADDAYVCEYVGRHLGTERSNRPGGIVLLRDATLQHYFQTVTLYLGDAHNYFEGMTQAHGELGRRAAPVVTKGAGHETLFRELDMLRFFLESAAAVLVSSSDLARRVEVLGGQLAPLVERTPRGVAPAARSPRLRAETLAAGGRAAAPGAPAYLVRLGGRGAERDLALAAGAALLASDAAARVVFQGGEPPEGPTARRAGWLPGAPPDEGDLPSWDAVIDLREPSAGQVLTETLRWMGAGVAVAVGDFPAYLDLPDAAVLRVAESAPLASLTAALSDVASRAAVAERGAAFVARHHTAERECDAILRFLSERGPDLAERSVILGNIREGILVERRRALCGRIREAVFEGVPVDLPGGIGAQWVREVEDELTRLGIDFVAPAPRSG